MYTNGPHTFIQACDSLHANAKDSVSSKGLGSAHAGLDDFLNGDVTHTYSSLQP